MISDKKLAKWCRLVDASDSRFEFNLDVSDGVKWEASPPYPDLVVRNSKIVHVRRTVVQELLLTASVPEDRDQAEIVVQRLVAELETGQEIELMRQANPAADSDQIVDMDVCTACGEQIAGGSDGFNTVVINDKPYHKRCTS